MNIIFLIFSAALLTSCNFTDNMLGNGGDNTTGTESYGGLDSTAPNAPSLDSSIISIIPSYTATGECETDSVVTIKGDINPNPTSVTCIDGRYSADITFNAPEEKKALNITQTDLAGNTSQALITQINYRSIAAISSLNSNGGRIVHANMSAYPMDGSCSHDGSNNIQITGGFAGSPVTVDCIDEAWSYSADYSAVGDSMAVDNVIVTHMPGQGVSNGSVSESFDHCRRTSTMTYNDDSSFRYNFGSIPEALHQPIINYGDGTPDLVVDDTQHTIYTYTTGNAPYTIELKHCPTELEDFYINDYVFTSANMSYTLNSIFPGGSNEYQNLVYFSLVHRTSGSNGLSGSLPNSNDFPSILTFNLYGHENATGTIQASIDCNATPSLREYSVIFTASNTPQITGNLPTMPNICSDLTQLRFDYTNLAGSFISFTQVPNIEQYQFRYTDANGSPGANLPASTEYFYISDTALTGSLPDPSSAIGLLRYYADRLDNANTLTPITHNFLANNTNLQYLLLQNGDGGGLNGNMPTISHIPSLIYYAVSSNNLDISPGSFPNPENLTNLAQYQINANNITGGPYSYPDITTNPSMINWYISDVDFSGSSFPSDLTSLSNLKNLYSPNNSMTGTIPNFSGLTKLEYINLSGNAYTNAPAGLTYDSTIFRNIIFHNNNLTTGAIDIIVDAIYNSRNNWNVVGSPDFQIHGTNASASLDAQAKMDGAGAYAGDGIAQQGVSVNYNP